MMLLLLLLLQLLRRFGAHPKQLFGVVRNLSDKSWYSVQIYIYIDIHIDNT